jgi:hypothetical protein
MSQVHGKTNEEVEREISNEHIPVAETRDAKNNAKDDRDNKIELYYTKEAPFFHKY